MIQAAKVEASRVYRRTQKVREKYLRGATSLTSDTDQILSHRILHELGKIVCQ